MQQNLIDIIEEAATSSPFKPVRRWQLRQWLKEALRYSTYVRRLEADLSYVKKENLLYMDIIKTSKDIKNFMYNIHNIIENIQPYSCSRVNVIEVGKKTEVTVTYVING